MFNKCRAKLGSEQADILTEFVTLQLLQLPKEILISYLVTAPESSNINTGSATHAVGGLIKKRNALDLLRGRLCSIYKFFL